MHNKIKKRAVFPTLQIK